MHKKRIALLLALALSAPCLFSLGSCDKELPPAVNTNEVTEQQWKAALTSVDSLKLSTRRTYEEEQYESEKEEEKEESARPAYVVSKYDGCLFHKGDFEIYDNRNAATFYTTETDGSEISYVKRLENNGFEKESADPSEFIYTQAFFDTFTSVLVDRYSEFTFTEGLNNDTYVLNAFSDAFNGVTQALTEYFGQAFTLAEIELEFHSGVLTDLVYKNDTVYNPDKAGQLDFGIYPTQGVLTYHLKTMFDGLDNYTLEGGEGANYTKLEFADGKFHLYMPNVADATQREAYWHKDESGATTKYVFYSKNASGAWVKDDTRTETQYKNACGNLADMFFMKLAKCVDLSVPQAERPRLEYRNGAYYLNHYADGDAYLKDIFTQASIYVDENHQIANANYHLRREGHLQGEPAEYDMTLTAGSTTIVLPNA